MLTKSLLEPLVKLNIAIILSVSLAACSSSGGSSVATEVTDTDEEISAVDETPDENSTDTIDETDNTDNTESENDTTEGDVEPGNETTNADVDENSDNNAGDNTTEPVTPADVVASAVLPMLDAAGTVTWAFDAKPSGVEVHVQPYLELPLASNGNPARWNSMSTFGNRVFVSDEQDGNVYEITDRETSLWFNIAQAIQAHTGRALSTTNLFHGGVRGIAFHPNFLTNGKFYASVMEERPANPANHNYISDNSGINADSVLIEWTADTTTLTIDPASYREVFRVGVPEYDHPIKQIAFNPYVSSGDGDFGILYIAHGDGSIASTLTGTGHNNDALGKILRINPLQAGDQPYTVPLDNPFTNDNSLPNEVFSYGHRNPHHLALTTAGHLLTTEAGRDNIEEINLVTRGSDYGWAQREGTFTHLDVGTLFNGISALPTDDATNGYVYPAVQFGHHGTPGVTFTGEALGGGYVVENGSPIDGEFFFIDFPKSGILFHANLNDIVAANTSGAAQNLTSAQAYTATIKYDHDANPNTPALDSTLKEIVTSSSGFVNTNDRVDIRILQGHQGELYMTSKRNNMVYLVTSSLPLGLADPAAQP